MSFPEVYLEAVNAEARRLFSSKSTTVEPVKGLVDDLQAKLEELDKAISSIKRQLIDRNEDDPLWAKSARHAQRKYYLQRSSVVTLLKTANSTLMLLNAEQARNAKNERLKNAQETFVTANKVIQDAKTQRSIESNKEQLRWVRVFKRICKVRLGEPLYLELVKEANAKIEAGEGYE